MKKNNFLGAIMLGIFVLIMSSSLKSQNYSFDNNTNCDVTI
jgi:hypothetical protein